jgi:hypothetical protein
MKRLAGLSRLAGERPDAQATLEKSRLSWQGLSWGVIHVYCQRSVCGSPAPFYSSAMSSDAS